MTLAWYLISGHQEEEAQLGTEVPAPFAQGDRASSARWGSREWQLMPQVVMVVVLWHSRSNSRVGLVHIDVAILYQIIRFTDDAFPNAHS